MRHLIALLSICTFLTSSTLHAQVPSYVPTNGLVGWWPFNGNANDESGNGNNGTNNGATLTTDRFGNSNSAYDFNGLNNLIRIPHQNSLNLIGDYSISVWYKGNYQNIFNNGWTFIAKRDDNGNCCSPNVPYQVFIPFNGTYYAVPATAYANGNYTFSIPPNTSPISLDQWQNLIITNTSDLLKFYINGELIFSENISSTLRAPNTADLLIGSVNRELGAEWMNGKLDDIGIWNRALTEQEIQSLYTGQGSSPCVSPTAVSFSGLAPSYTTSDGPATLTGTPAGGVFIGPGVTGSTFSPAVAGEGIHSIQYVTVDNDGCVNSAGLCTSVSLGMGLEPGGNAPGGVRVFPNPNRGQFTVELELAGLVGLQVFDARGALVHNEVFTASGSRTQRTLDLSAFAKGSYTLLVEHNGQRVTQAVVVE